MHRLHALAIVCGADAGRAAVSPQAQRGAAPSEAARPELPMVATEPQRAYLAVRPRGDHPAQPSMPGRMRLIGLGCWRGC